MGNKIFVQELLGAMTDYEQLTEEALNKAAEGEVTFQELESMLRTHGLSMEYVIHDPGRHYLSTFYADYQHGRYLDIYLNRKYINEVLPEFIKVFLREGDIAQELADRDWARYYHKRVPVPLLIFDFQKRYRDIPPEHVFSTWYAIYKRIDYSNDMWNREVLDYVFAHAPQAQLPDTEPDGLVTLYRGMGALSQPPEKAISWSSHPTSALWFAIHFARGTHIAVARVRPDQIVAYYPSYYAENEVIIRPGTVREYHYEDMIPATEAIVPSLLAPALVEFLQYGRQAIGLGYPEEGDFGGIFRIHGITHILRVLLLSLIYYHHSGDALTEEDRNILIYFSLLHDVGRTNDDVDPTHGDSSVELIHRKGIRLRQLRLSKKDYHIAELLIRHHCRADHEGIALIQEEPGLTVKDKARVCKLYNICKDMDGLDRVRFNGLDYRLLRTEYARRLPLIAGCLLEEKVMEFITSNPEELK